MALASLNQAASNLSALAAKLTPTSLGALIPAKLAAIPVIAGLAVGTAAGASFVAGPSPEPKTQLASTAVVAPAAIAAPAAAVAPVAPAAAPAARSCEQQTWPYIEARCMTNAPQQQRRVRLVRAPRPGEASDAKLEPALVTSDTVLRQPQNIEAIPPAVTAKPARREKRKEARRKRERFTAQSYQVPYEQRRASGAVVVVRPMRLDTFR